MRPPPPGPVNFSFFGATEAVAIPHHPSLRPARQTPPVSPSSPPPSLPAAFAHGKCRAVRWWRAGRGHSGEGSIPPRAARARRSPTTRPHGQRAPCHLPVSPVGTLRAGPVGLGREGGTRGDGLLEPPSSSPGMGECPKDTRASGGRATDFQSRLHGAHLVPAPHGHPWGAVWGPQGGRRWDIRDTQHPAAGAQEERGPAGRVETVASPAHTHASLQLGAHAAPPPAEMLPGPT